MRYIGSIIFLALIALIAFGSIQFKDSPLYQTYRTKAENFIQYVKKWGQAKRHNMRIDYSIPAPKEEWVTGEQEVVSSRNPPMSLLLAKTKLENFFPDQFVKTLKQDDWDYIFSLIYEPVSEKQGDFSVKRYLNKEEIEQDLIYQYNFPFSHFREQHWSYFWEIVLKNG